MAFDFVLSENNITVDLSVLQDLVGDDITSIKPIIELFFTSMPTAIEKMKFYEDQQDWENLFKTAHSVKSSVSIIKVSGLYDTIVAIENNLTDKTNLESIKQAIAFIETNYLFAEKLLKKQLQKIQ